MRRRGRRGQRRSGKRPRLLPVKPPPLLKPRGSKETPWTVIARQLNAAGFLTPRGGLWSATQVKHVLEAEVGQREGGELA